MAPVGYLVGQEALDVARLTGVRLRTARHREWEASDIDPNAVTGEVLPFVYLALPKLTWAERWRVAWARIGAHTLLDYLEGRTRGGSGRMAGGVVGTPDCGDATGSEGKELNSGTGVWYPGGGWEAKGRKRIGGDPEIEQLRPIPYGMHGANGGRSG